MKVIYFCEVIDSFNVKSILAGRQLIVLFSSLTMMKKINDVLIYTIGILYDFHMKLILMIKNHNFSLIKKSFLWISILIETSYSQISLMSILYYFEKTSNKDIMSDSTQNGTIMMIFRISNEHKAKTYAMIPFPVL